MLVLLLGWNPGQLGGATTLAPLLAAIADQVPEHQRGGVSANVGIMQNLDILVAAWSRAGSSTTRRRSSWFRPSWPSRPWWPAAWCGPTGMRIHPEPCA